MAEDETPSSSRVHVHGSVFGGGNKAGVLVNSEVNMSKGLVEGNVYGGGNLGDVGTHADKTPVSVGNYDWKDQDGNIITASTAANKMTGISQVNIIGGEIGLGSSETSEITKEHGNVFGGGKGEASTFECEKGMVYQTNVSINTSGTVVHGNVYGGGEVSRVEGNTVVTIGTASGSDVPTIEGSVFGAGAGLETHGYSALVRGTSTVIVQGKAHVIKNVYGGGEMASVGRYNVADKACGFGEVFHDGGFKSESNCEIYHESHCAEYTVEEYIAQDRVSYECEADKRLHVSYYKGYETAF